MLRGWFLHTRLLIVLGKLFGRVVPLRKALIGVVGMLHSRKSVLWIIIGGATCLFGFIFLIIPLRQQGNANSPSSFPTISPSPFTIDSGAALQDTDLVQNTVVPSTQSELEQKQSPPPPPDEAAVEIRRKMVVDLNAKIRAETRTLYGAAFQQIGLPANIQERVIDILTQQQKQL